MRTNIVINDRLLNQAMKVSGLTTKKAVVERGLQTLLDFHQQKTLKKLRGAAHWEGNLDESRCDE